MSRPAGALVVASCADSGELRTWTLDEDSGALAARQVLPLGGMLMPMALHPQLPRLPRLYVARRSEPLAVITCAISADGTLEPLAEAPLPASMAAIACDRSGRWLLSASYGADLIAVGPVDAQGRAGVPAATHATGRHAHAMVCDRANRRVFSTALGADGLHRFDFDAATGTLGPAALPVHPMRPGSGPRHLVFDAAGTRLYVIGELDGGIDVLAYEPHAGTLDALQTVSCLPPGTPGGAWAAELRLSPDGCWLIATERRSSTVSVYAVGADGRLGLADRLATEAQPRGAQWSPQGRHVLVAGQASHHVAVHAWDAEAARLRVADRAAAGANPNWVEALSLDAGA